MNPKLFWLFTAILLVSTARAGAQQPKNIPRIDVLSASSPSASSRRIKAFQQGLAERGYVDGTNIKIEYR